MMIEGRAQRKSAPNLYRDNGKPPWRFRGALPPEAFPIRVCDLDSAPAAKPQPSNGIPILAKSFRHLVP
jgi:hypothetical protein